MFEGKNGMTDKVNDIGDNHIGSSAKTPLREDAFEISPADKIVRIQKSVRDILSTLGMDLEDDSLKGTPSRVAKAFVTEISVNELKHYAEDAGKSEEEIAEITEAEKTFAFEADGVLLKQ